MDNNSRKKTYKIEVHHGNEVLEILRMDNKSILEALHQHKIFLNASCGGRGTCGKCKIKIEQGDIEITKPDESCLTKEELARGYRLACKAYPKGDCIISDLQEEDAFDIIAHSSIDQTVGQRKEDDRYGIAIDIGTTTIVVSLISQRDGTIIKSYTSVNKQGSYGADVISRIQASNQGKKTQLQIIIQELLLEGIQTVSQDARINKSQVKKITIAANTTMQHLLMGYDCESLGVYPFTPVATDMEERHFSEVISSDFLEVPVVLLPGISTFVGADVVGGILACRIDQSEELCLFIDLGTNGEMAIGNKDGMLVCSAAAGPAFEGGNIQEGVGSIPGAICHVSIDNQQVKFETIANKPAIGICGTGVIEVASELLKTGKMNGTGLFEDPYFQDGFQLTSRNDEQPKIVITQKDIREIQLAKAAIRTGIELLMKEYGTTYEQIHTVYLAGGFGYRIDTEKAIHIGLIPEEFRGKIKVVGNTSLAGAIQTLVDENATKRLKEIVLKSKEITLSNTEGFQERYIANMNFVNE